MKLIGKGNSKRELPELRKQVCFTALAPQLFHLQKDSAKLNCAKNFYKHSATSSQTDAFNLLISFLFKG